MHKGQFRCRRCDAWTTKTLAHETDEECIAALRAEVVFAEEQLALAEESIREERRARIVRVASEDGRQAIVSMLLRKRALDLARLIRDGLSPEGRSARPPDFAKIVETAVVKLEVEERPR